MYSLYFRINNLSKQQNVGRVVNSFRKWYKVITTLCSLVEEILIVYNELDNGE